MCSPVIINHEDNFLITVKELALSMKPRQELSNNIVEVAIQTINHNLDRNGKKFVMPLRIGVSTISVFRSHILLSFSYIAHSRLM